MLVLFDREGVVRSPVALVGLIAVLYSVAASTPGFALSGRGLAVLMLSAVASVGWLGWLVLARRHGRVSVAALMVVGVGGAVIAGLAPRGGAVAFAFVLMIVAARTLELTPAAAIGAVTLCSLIVSWLAIGRHVGTTLGFSAGLATAFLFGRNVRGYVLGGQQADLLLAETQVAREEQARSAALNERARIAREIHDVLAHSLSALTVQLEGTRMLLSSGDRSAALEQIDRARRLARDGLAESRRAIGALRGDTQPFPRLLEQLLRVHGDGTNPSLQIDGRVPEVKPDVALAVYRTAQEAITNARKYAPGAAVEVRLDYRDGLLALIVADRHPAGERANAGPLAAAGGGYGLVGLRERAELLNGTLTAGPTPEGWRVELKVPA